MKVGKRIVDWPLRRHLNINLLPHTLSIHSFGWARLDLTDISMDSVIMVLVLRDLAHNLSAWGDLSCLLSQ